MSEELNNEIKTEKCECKCCAYLKKFMLITSAVFVGSTLSILVCAGILSPKMPCMPPMPFDGAKLEHSMHFQDDVIPPKHFKHHKDFKIEHNKDFEAEEAK